MGKGKPGKTTACSKDGRQLMAAVQAAGGHITRTTRGHLLIRGPRGTTTVSSKLEGPRGIHHAVTALRRIGLSIDS